MEDVEEVRVVRSRSWECRASEAIEKLEMPDVGIITPGLTTDAFDTGRMGAGLGAIEGKGRPVSWIDVQTNTVRKLCNLTKQNREINQSLDSEQVAR
jgi:hypothetical protein